MAERKNYGVKSGNKADNKIQRRVSLRGASYASVNGTTHPDSETVINHTLSDLCNQVEVLNLAMKDALWTCDQEDEGVRIDEGKLFKAAIENTENSLQQITGGLADFNREKPNEIAECFKGIIRQWDELLKTHTFLRDDLAHWDVRKQFRAMVEDLRDEVHTAIKNGFATHVRKALRTGGSEAGSGRG